MVDTIALTVTDEALAESLKDCEAGEEKTLTFKVTAKDMATISGDVTAIEGYGEEEPEADYDGEEETPTPPVKSNGRKMPKAIEMIGSGK